MEVFIGKSRVNSQFSIAMFDYQRVFLLRFVVKILPYYNATHPLGGIGLRFEVAFDVTTAG